MTEYFKTDADGFARDPRSKAIINTNKQSMAQYKQQRAERLARESLSDEVNSLKQDVQDIKNMLQEICKRL